MNKEITQELEIFKKINSRNYDSSCCFLCGEDINENSLTSEHVIPRWLQKRFNLWDQRIILLNQTSCPYRYLKIPCCKRCNNVYLKPIEDELKLRFESGFKEFKKINKEILFFWLGKIYYGILYREMSLLLDRSDIKKGFMMSSAFMKSFSSHWMFLQGIRGKHKFQDFFPASIFIFRTQKPKEIKLQWDFMDNLQSMFIAIRMGEIGVIAVLQDGETQEKMKNLLNDFFKIPLHPIQFQEVAAQISYKSLLLNRVSKYVSIEQGNCIKTLQMPLTGHSSKPLFDKWDHIQYMKILSSYMRISSDTFNSVPADKSITYIKNKEGKIHFMDIKKYPFVKN